LTVLWVAVSIQAATLVLLWGFENRRFVRLPKLLFFAVRFLFCLLSFLFCLAVLIELRSEHQVSLFASVALWVWMAFGIMAMGWSFFLGWISKDGPTGWTIIVATILFVFASLTSVPGREAREIARRTQCLNNLKQVGTVLVNDEEKHAHFPAPVTKLQGGPPTSWRVTFLSALESPPVAYFRAQAWNAPANRDAGTSPVSVYSCPSNWHPHDEQNRWLASYALVTGPGTISPGEKSLGRLDISDGAANTLLAVEAAGLRIVWSEPRDADVSREPICINLPGDRVGNSPGLLSSYHPNVALAIMADGSVRFLNQRIDPNVLRAFTTANGRDSVEQRTSDD
jgi:hypothetical protein